MLHTGTLAIWGRAAPSEEGRPVIVAARRRPDQSPDGLADPAGPRNGKTRPDVSGTVVGMEFGL